MRKKQEGKEGIGPLTTTKTGFKKKEQGSGQTEPRNRAKLDSKKMRFQGGRKTGFCDWDAGKASNMGKTWYGKTGEQAREKVDYVSS